MDWTDQNCLQITVTFHAVSVLCFWSAASTLVNDASLPGFETLRHNQIVLHCPGTVYWLYS